MKELAGSVAVVTGGASGIGLAIGTALGRRGASLLLTDIDGDAASARAEELRADGAVVEACGLDVRDPDAVDRIADMATERFGALHIAVNNAGIVNGGLTWELPLDDWRAVLDVNLWGVIHGIRSFVPRILASGRDGHVVNVASMAAVLPHASLGPYTVAKHGVLAISDVLRADLEAAGAPVGVSVVMPGAIRTSMNPIGTIEPEVVAANVIDAILGDRPYVFTDHQATRSVERRLQAILAARADVLPAPSEDRPSPAGE